MQTNRMAPLTLQNILDLPREVTADPLLLASRLNCDSAELDPVFAELSSLIAKLQPAEPVRKSEIAHPMTPSSTETEPTVSQLVLPAKLCRALPPPHRRPRTTFGVHEQALLYSAFCADPSINQERLAALAATLSRNIREVRGWWYNKRSDVHDTGRVRIPVAVQREMRKNLE